MIRSSTASWAHWSAVCWFIEGSNAVTFEGMLTDGIAGKTHTWPVAETGPELLLGGSAAAAVTDTQVAQSGPEPTPRASLGVEPSGGSGAGSAPRVESWAATCRAVAHKSVPP